MFVMIDYVRKISVKESCKYGEYRLFEHLLFLFNYCFFSMLVSWLTMLDVCLLFLYL